MRNRRCVRRQRPMAASGRAASPQLAHSVELPAHLPSPFRSGTPWQLRFHDKENELAVMQNCLWFLAWYFSIGNYDNRLISFDIKTQVMQFAHASTEFKTIAQQRKAWRFRLSEGIKTLKYQKGASHFLWSGGC